MNLLKLILVLCGFFATVCNAQAADPWTVLEGGTGPGAGKHIVLIAADDEYRSEELIPQLAKILAKHHGFKCTVLFAIDKNDGTINPGQKDNIPGLKFLKDADLMVFFARFRELPDDQMKLFMDYTHSGKPIVALRTSTHPFHYVKHKDSPYAKYTWTSKDPKGGWGREVLGETWVNHHGRHKVESTRGLIAKGQENHPIVRGVEEIWGPSDVYGLTTLKGDCQPIIMGQVLVGLKPDDKPHPTKQQFPVAWTKTYTGDSGKAARVFATTMGHGGDFLSAGFRRLMVNGCYWAMGLESEIPAKSNVEIVGEYQPSPIGVGKHIKGQKPSDIHF